MRRLGCGVITDDGSMYARPATDSAIILRFVSEESNAVQLDALGAEGRNVYVDVNNVANSRDDGRPEWDTYLEILRTWRRLRSQDRFWPVADWGFHGALSGRVNDQLAFERAARDGSADDGVSTIETIRIYQTEKGTEADDVILASADGDPRSVILTRDILRDKRDAYPWLQHEHGQDGAACVDCRLWWTGATGYPPRVTVEFKPITKNFDFAEINDAKEQKRLDRALREYRVGKLGPLWSPYKRLVSEGTEYTWDTLVEAGRAARFIYGMAQQRLVLKAAQVTESGYEISLVHTVEFKDSEMHVMVEAQSSGVSRISFKVDRPHKRIVWPFAGCLLVPVVGWIYFLFRALIVAWPDHTEGLDDGAAQVVRAARINLAERLKSTNQP